MIGGIVVLVLIGAWYVLVFLPKSRERFRKQLMEEMSAARQKSEES